MHIIPRPREEYIKEPYSSISPIFYLGAGIVELIVGIFLLLIPMPHNKIYKGRKSRFYTCESNSALAEDNFFCLK